MTLETATKFRLYYDSNASNPNENHDAVRSRLADLATDRGIELRETDVADLSEERVARRCEEVVDLIGDGKEYVVDGRVLNDSVFGSVRPVLVIEYGDDRPADVYPHRNGDVSAIPIGVTQFLDEVGDGDPDRGDFARIHGDDDTGAGDATGAAEPGSHLLASIRGTLTSILPG